jgi:hypothetical protein
MVDLSLIPLAFRPARQFIRAPDYHLKNRLFGPELYDRPKIAQRFPVAAPLAVVADWLRFTNPAPRLIISCSSSVLLERAIATSMVICFWK